MGPKEAEHDIIIGNTGTACRFAAFSPQRLHHGLLATRIPLFAEKLGLQESILGVMILVFGIGSIVMMPVAGSRIARFGSRRVSVVSTILYLPTLLLAVLAPNIPLAAVALFLFGGLTGAWMSRCNANAVETEKAMGRRSWSSGHAFWSLGGLFGAGLGGWLITAAGPLVMCWPRPLLPPSCS